jgi:threonine/homoserine/homoserine lactone efflux protein
MLFFLYTGTMLGLSAGVSPGPLSTLVITQSLQHGAREGAKVALAPLLTDLPLIAIAMLALSRLPELDAALGVVSLCGGLFVCWLGASSLRQGPLVVSELEASAPRSVLKGLLVNVLSPHPYVFWFTVGGPLCYRAYQEESALAAVGFAVSFFTFIVGSKVTLAMLVGRARGWLEGRAYTYLLRVLGIGLLVFGALLVHDGLRFLKLL